MKKIDAFKYFNKKSPVQEYSETYKKLRFDIRYSQNVKREEIFVNLVKNIDQKKLWMLVVVLECL